MSRFYNAFDVGYDVNVAASGDGIPASFNGSRLPNAPQLVTEKVSSRPLGSSVYYANTRIAFPITGGPGMGFFAKNSGYIFGYFNFKAQQLVRELGLTQNMTGITTTHINRAVTIVTGANVAPFGWADEDTNVSGSVLTVNYLIYDGPCYSSNTLRRDQELKFNDRVYMQNRLDIITALSSGSRQISRDYAAQTCNVIGALKGTIRDVYAGIRSIDYDRLEVGKIATLKAFNHVATQGNAGAVGTADGTINVINQSVVIDNGNDSVHRTPFIWRTECPILDNENHQLPLFLLPHGEFAIYTTDRRDPLLLVEVSPVPSVFAVDNINHRVSVITPSFYAPYRFRRLALTTWSISDLWFFYERRKVGPAFERNYQQVLAASNARHMIPFNDYQHQNQGVPQYGQNHWVMNLSSQSVNGTICAIQYIPTTAASGNQAYELYRFSIEGVSRYWVKYDGVVVMQDPYIPDQRKRIFEETRIFFDGSPWRMSDSYLSSDAWSILSGCLAISTLKATERDMVNRGTSVVRDISFDLEFTKASGDITAAGITFNDIMLMSGGQYSRGSEISLAGQGQVEGPPLHGAANYAPALVPSGIASDPARINSTTEIAISTQLNVHLFASISKMLHIGPDGTIVVVS